MAVLTGVNIHRVWFNDAADKVTVYRLDQVTTSDTVDLGPSGPVGDYLVVKQCVILATTVAGSAAAAVSGTVVTMPSGLSGDAGYMMAWGDSS